MPGRRGVENLDSSLCRRCQVNEPAITARNEPLCKSCFCKYVSTKIIKRMETFRVRHSSPGQPRTLLLPLSFGACSTSLLHVLSQHLQGQVEKTGRTGFRLHVLHIEEDLVSSSSDEAAVAFEKTKSLYADHAYSYMSLSHVFSYEDPEDSILCDGNTAATANDSTGQDKLNALLTSLDSTTSRADMIQILKTKLIVAFAKQQECEAIVWGHSTTTLAERVLSDTVKGRGFSLPWKVSDGESPYGIPFHYPMRDVLSHEIIAFASLVDLPLDDLILKSDQKPAISMKDTTIDDLMKQYFISVEREYPAIVTNVVKTTGKLQGPSLNQIENQCELCDMPLDGNAPEKSRLCYGCVRTFPVLPD